MTLGRPFRGEGVGGIDCCALGPGIAVRGPVPPPTGETMGGAGSLEARGVLPSVKHLPPWGQFPSSCDPPPHMSAGARPPREGAVGALSCPYQIPLMLQRLDCDTPAPRVRVGAGGGAGESPSPQGQAGLSGNVGHGAKGAAPPAP